MSSPSRDYPAGVPVYNFEILLKQAGLATVTTLRQERLEIPEDQKPAGCYWSGHAWVLLYHQSDAVAMAPLTPGRQQMYDRNRTCARCSAKQPTPFRRARDGARYCTPCHIPAAEKLWDEEREKDRPEITTWAREVLADPTVVLGAKKPGLYWTTKLVIGLDRSVLLHENVLDRLNYPQPNDADPTEPQPTSAGDIRDKVLALRGRRLISWWPTTAPKLSTSWDDTGRTTEVATEMRPGDALGNWYDRWLREPASESHLTYSPRIRQNIPPLDPHECLEKMLAFLHEAAAG